MSFIALAAVYSSVEGAKALSASQGAVGSVTREHVSRASHGREFVSKTLLSGVPGSSGMEGWVVQSELGPLCGLALCAKQLGLLGLLGWPLQFKVMVTRGQACPLVAKLGVYDTQRPPVCKQEGQ